MKTKIIGYWVTTIVIECVLLSGGITNLMHYDANVQGVVHHLGYPLYFLTIIGTWKILGAIAIVWPGFSRIREWAFAGIFFELSGAVVSHLAVGDGIFKALVPAMFVAIALASRSLFPYTRHK